MKFFLFLILIVISFSCTNGQDPKGTGSLLPPVENRKPNSSFTPAFPEQTRAPGMKTRSEITITELTDRLERPWDVVALPDGKKLLITEKSGNLRIVSTDGKTGDKITGLPAVNSNGQGGLLGLALDPGFTVNRMVYWSFSEDGPYGTLTAVAKGKLSTDEKKILNASVIYRAVPAHDGVLHYGSRLVFDKYGFLFVSTGERSDLETRPQAQSLKSALGKVLRISKDGKPAAGNPFINSGSALAEIYSYGHRNVQSLAIHPVTGELWEAEMGPRGGDELNRIQPGKNYGWPVITYGIEYSGKQISSGKTRQEGMEQPIYYWDPVLSPSGMCFYSGEKISEWKNDLFICGLNSNHIARVRIRNNKVIGEERLLADRGQRFRDICEGTDGALYAVTDEGKLYKISAGQ